MAILIDASVFCAYANSRDVHHESAKKVMGEVVSGKYGSGITTDYVFDETVSVIQRRLDKKSAVEVGKSILNSEIFLASIGTPVFEKAWEVFEAADGLSFTDCTSVAFIRLFNVGKIATFDKGFRGVKGIQVVDNGQQGKA